MDLCEKVIAPKPAWADLSSNKCNQVAVIK